MLNLLLCVSFNPQLHVGERNYHSLPFIQPFNILYHLHNSHIRTYPPFHFTEPLCMNYTNPLVVIPPVTKVIQIMHTNQLILLQQDCS